ncbi:MAG: DUF3857 domain-containing protein [Bacteroidales bacterium]|nr:DUF3857 domain-containing protein [Bacteroidales bacterium]
MRYRLILPLMFIGAALSAQEKCNAVVLEDAETFVMDSPTSGTYSVRRIVQVNGKAGEQEAVFHEYTDQFRSLTAFKGTVERAGAKPVKLKKDDLMTVSMASGLAEDGFLVGYVPAGTYPYTVTYEYTMNYRKGIAAFPAYVPVTSEKVRLEKGYYRLTVPAGTAISHFGERVGEVRKEEGKSDSYLWEVPVFEGFTEESMMPSWRSVVPNLSVAPVDFTYAGVKGSQGSWEDVGRWCYGLKEGAGLLPDDVVAQVRQMTASAGSDLERVRILYDYLRDHTRYVSIQLGIGGYKPFPAAQVHKSGFGDCKGLSNYLQAMLEAVGIPSTYTLVNTDRARFLNGYSGIGQMNHVMLCVPLAEQKDTLWVECTNAAVPLGYRHEDVAGHDVVLVTQEGGIPVRVPAYPDSLSRRVNRVEIDLREDGSAHLTVQKELYLDYTESWFGIHDWTPDERLSRLTRGLKTQPQDVMLTGVRDNFRDYDGPLFCPRMEVGYTFETRQYATVGKDRLFLPATPYNNTISLQRGKRQNDIVSESAYTLRDEIRIHLPAGFRLESLPSPVDIDSEWGAFRAEVAKDQDAVTIKQVFHGKRFHEPAARYDEYRTFVRAVNKAYGAGLVLVRDY